VGERAELKVLGSDGLIDSAVTDSLGSARLVNLGLEDDEYEVAVDGEFSRFHVRTARGGRKVEGVAVSPARNMDDANLYQLGTEMRATSKHVMYFRVEVTEEQDQQPWRLTLDSEDSARVKLYDSEGRTLMDRA